MSKEEAERELKRLTRMRAYRDARDPLIHMKFGPVQSLYWESTARYKLAEGPNRSGKTSIMIAKAAAILRNRHPRIKFTRPARFLFLVKERLQASQVIGQKLFKTCELPGPLGQYPFIPKREIEDLGQLKVGFHVPYHLKMKNGHEALFKWSDAPETKKGIQGLKLDGAFLDEDAGSLELLHEIYVRLADSRSEFPEFGGFIDWSATPEIGCDALTEFRKQCKSDREYFRVLIPRDDHSAIDAATVTALAKQLGDMAEVKVYGSKTSGDVYAVYGEQWSDERHMLAADYETRPTDNLWVGYDPGVDHASGVGVFAVSRDLPTRLTLIKFWNHKKLTVTEEVRILKEFLAGRRIAGVVYDTNAKNQDKIGQSTLGHMTQAMQTEGIMPLVGFHQSQKKHEPGIHLVRHYLNPNPDDRFAPPLLVFNPSDESGGQIAREQMLRLQARKKRRHAGDSLLIRGDDEAADVVRYVCMKRPAWNLEWACGNMHGTVRNNLGVHVIRPEEQRVLTPEQTHMKRLFDMSALAASRRSGGRRPF